jgi:hypothetical protein
MNSGPPVINRDRARIQGAGGGGESVIGRIIFALTLLVITCGADALAFPYLDFFDPLSPEHLNLTLFSSGYAADAYQRTVEGFELEQSLTRYVGVVGRASAYQVYHGDGFDTPFVSSRPGVRNFGRFEGGLDLIPLQGTSLVVFGGEDLGSSSGPVIDGRFSSWILFHSLHPINLSLNGSHYYHNGRSGGRVDLQMVTFSTEKLTLLTGVGGSIWGGGPDKSILHGQGGPDIGAFLRPWHTRMDLQFGYGGDQHTYGLLSVSRTFGWDE